MYLCVFKRLNAALYVTWFQKDFSKYKLDVLLTVIFIKKSKIDYLATFVKDDIFNIIIRTKFCVCFGQTKETSKRQVQTFRMSHTSLHRCPGRCPTST